MNQYSLPDGLKLPAFIERLWWIASPDSYLENCARRLGDTFRALSYFKRPLIFLSNPEDIRTLFAAPPETFNSGSENQILATLVGENSLLLKDGASHQRQRKLLMPPFHGERLRRYSQIIVDIAQKVADRWPMGTPLIARQGMQDITLQVIMQAVFGLRSGEHYEEIKPLLAYLTDVTGSPLRASLLFFKGLQWEVPWSLWGQMIQKRRRVYQLLQAEIDRRRQAPPQGDDILSLMMAARDEQGQPMSDGELCDEMMTLLFAGHETTATALAWAFYWVLRDEAVLKRVREEIDALRQDPNPQAIASLPYLNAVCQETLRLYPVAIGTFARVPKADIEVGNYTYPAGTILLPSIYLVHQREDLYPQPKQFRPERFLERQYAPHEFIPFGGGNRRCIGYALALLEMKLVLATIISRYELQLKEKRPLQPQRRGVTMAPTGGVKMVKVKLRSLSVITDEDN